MGQSLFRRANFNKSMKKSFNMQRLHRATRMARCLLRSMLWAAVASTISSCIHSKHACDGANPIASTDLQMLVDRMGDERAVEYLLQLHYRDCGWGNRMWYSDLDLDASAILAGARHPNSFASYEIKALYWAYLIFEKKYVTKKTTAGLRKCVMVEECTTSDF